MSQHSPRRRVALLVGGIWGLILPACASLEPVEMPSACCDCLVEHACTPATRDKCGLIVANGGLMPIDGACSDSWGCTPKCAAEGWKF